MTTPTPAGWFPDATTPGIERYWDGQAWTPQTRPVAALAKQGSWIGRHKALTALGAVLVLFVVIGVANSGGGKTNTNVADPLVASSQSPAAAPASPAAAATPSKPNDKGWVVQSLLTKDDGLGDWGGTARITNGNATSLTGTFTFTLARAGQQIGTLQGSANSVAAGQTVTVDLVSQDKISPGRFTYAFQTDASF